MYHQRVPARLELLLWSDAVFVLQCITGARTISSILLSRALTVRYHQVNLILPRIYKQQY